MIYMHTLLKTKTAISIHTKFYSFREKKWEEEGLGVCDSKNNLK